MTTDTDKFLDTLEIVEAVIAKMTELGPHRRSALRKWIMTEFKMCHVTSGRYVRLAQERLRNLTGKSAEDHTMRYLAKLDSIIYGEDTPDRNRIAAIDKAALMLGLYRGGIVAPQHGTLLEKLTAQNLQEALAQDEKPADNPDPAKAGEAGDGGKVPDNPAPVASATVHPGVTPDAGEGAGDGTPTGETRKELVCEQVSPGVAPTDTP